MRAAVFRGPRQIEVGERPDPAISEPTDAVVRVELGCVCGSDLWYYGGESPHLLGAIGHEFICIVDAVGADIRTVGVGDFVIALFKFSDLEGIPEAYAAMDERRAVKALVRVGAA